MFVSFNETIPGITTLEWDGNIDAVPLAEGKYSYEIVLEDEAGNRSNSVQDSVGIDLTPPLISVDGSGFNANVGMNGTVLSCSISDNLVSEAAGLELSIFSGSDQVLAGVAESVAIPQPGVAVQKSITWNGQNASANFLPDGDYYFRLIGVDAAGNKSEPVSGSLGVDTSAPVTTLKTAGLNSWIGPSTDLVLEAFDIGLGLQGTYYKINDGAPILYTSPIHLLQSGEYQF